MTGRNPELQAAPVHREGEMSWLEAAWLLTSSGEHLARKWLSLSILLKALARTAALPESVKVSSIWEERREAATLSRELTPPPAEAALLNSWPDSHSPGSGAWPPEKPGEESFRAGLPVQGGGLCPIRAWGGKQGGPGSGGWQHQLPPPWCRRKGAKFLLLLWSKESFGGLSWQGFTMTREESAEGKGALTAARRRWAPEEHSGQPPAPQGTWALCVALGWGPSTQEGTVPSLQGDEQPLPTLLFANARPSR